ncbi:MAG: FAD-dependent oxidoreductase [Candidatus Izimaplasma sp.]|nr:FAD-dependent oxidoreductase [Candidatus Izimaplasma bacterium]
MKLKKLVSIFNPMRLWKYLFKKPVTHPLNQIFTQKNADYLNDNYALKKKSLTHSEPRQAPANTRGFHTNDWEECIGCSTCADICPTEAITMVERLELDEKTGEHQQRPAIDYGRCCFCALCVDTCTTGSLEMSNEYIYANDDPDKFFFLPTDTWEGKKVEKGYVRDETSELLDLKRVDMPHVDPQERGDNFVEIVRGYSKEYAKKEAARCVECGVCESSCPVQMHIPDYIRAIWEDDIAGGLKTIYETNPLPGVCGRVCTHNCETACAIAERGEAIAIRWLKRYIIDMAPDSLYKDILLEPVSELIDKQVAIVGSGPAGLGAAYYLRVLGYQVDVYEEMPKAGGVMRYGIPAYRLPDEAIDKDIEFIKTIGVKIHTNTRVGKDIKMKTLKEENDAVFLGTGFFKPRDLKIKGSDHKNVVGAMDILPQVREYERGNLDLDDINIEESAVVIGGGDVAFDVARSVTRLQRKKYGKSDVKLTSLENEDVLPASDDEYKEGNEEGIEFHCGNGPQEVMQDNDGNVTGLRLWECLCIFDEEGAFNPEFDDECEKIITGKQIFIAIGQAPDYDYLPKSIQDKIKIKRGKIVAEETGQIAGLDWLFVGGDIFRGPDLISGVADGHRAAKGIDEVLFNKDKELKNHQSLKEMREAVKYNTPKLTLKQKGN